MKQEIAKYVEDNGPIKATDLCLWVEGNYHLSTYKAPAAIRRTLFNGLIKTNDRLQFIGVK